MKSIYQMLNGSAQLPVQPLNTPQPMNMFGRIGEITQAMRNPAAYIKQKFPDIPANIQNDPAQILSYLQQTRGISNQDIQQVYNNANQVFGGKV